MTNIEVTIQGTLAADAEFTLNGTAVRSAVDTTPRLSCYRTVHHSDLVPMREAAHA